VPFRRATHLATVSCVDGDANFFEAYDGVLTPLFTAGNLVELVTGADRSGLMAALREPVSLADLVRRSGLAREMVHAICRALWVNAVVEEVDGGYRLTGAWRALTGPAAFVPLATAVAGRRVQGRLLEAAGAGETWWTIPSEDRLTFARAISPDPYSDALVAGMRAAVEADPEQAPMLAGGRLLELGCGVAGRILTVLRGIPDLRAVGVELSPDLAAEARRRAVELGVADRFRVVCADATTYADPEPFDFGFWSQFFFPTESRKAALEMLFASLRPGGTVWAPVMGDHAAMRGDPHGRDARDHALFRVMLQSWGVPERSPDDLAAEFEDAGFVDIGVRGGGSAGPVRVRARRP
jgi:SAM-dependent methyltransferase